MMVAMREHFQPLPLRRTWVRFHRHLVLRPALQGHQGEVPQVAVVVAGEGEVGKMVV